MRAGISRTLERLRIDLDIGDPPPELCVRRDYDREPIPMNTALAPAFAG